MLNKNEHIGYWIPRHGFYPNSSDFNLICLNLRIIGQYNSLFGKFVVIFVFPVKNSQIHLLNNSSSPNLWLIVLGIFHNKYGFEGLSLVNPFREEQMTFSSIISASD